MTKKLFALIAIMSLALAGCASTTMEDDTTADVESIQVEEAAAEVEVVEEAGEAGEAGEMEMEASE